MAMKTASLTAMKTANLTANIFLYLRKWNGVTALIIYHFVKKQNLKTFIYLYLRFMSATSESLNTWLSINTKNPSELQLHR